MKYIIVSLKWINLITKIFLALFFHTSCLYSSTSAELILSHGEAQHNPYSLMDSRLGKVALQSSKPESSSSIHESTSSVTKIAKFDLNQFPEDVDPALDDIQVEKISDLASEKGFNQDSKRQKLITAGQHFSPEASQSLKIMTNIYSPEINSHQVTNELKTCFDQSSSAHRLKNVYCNRNAEIWKPSKAQSISVSNSIGKGYNSENPIEADKQNHKFEESKNKNYHSKSLKSANLSKKRKPISANNLEAVSLTRNTLQVLKFIIDQLSKKNVNSGPLDLKSERTYISPYNRDLLQFIEQNLSNIVHGSLSEFEIDKNFFEAVKSLLWKDNEGVFYTTEKVISELMDNVNRKCHVHTSKTWVKYSHTAQIMPSDSTSAACKFQFREVFSKILTYENFSTFLFTDSMRQKSKERFKDIEKRLYNKKKEIKISGQSLNNFIGRIWDGLAGFLAYVHAITALIPSDSSLPLTNSKLENNQEEALDFFFELNKDAENFLRNYTQRRNKKTYYDKCWRDLSYEDKVQRSLDEIFNLKTSKDKKAWLYIELWMIRCRPELYLIATKKLTGGISDTRSKFRSIVNRIFFPFFSGIQKYYQLERSKRS
ncbi:hypothetical protein BY996DRAFT_7873425 [Phakopsora pachyrhizi]|nr:hypothetical protein BY996DRAFT_7873425 [Phakopsora pachyrhizi]